MALAHEYAPVQFPLFGMTERSGADLGTVNGFLVAWFRLGARGISTE
jgi:hypothetical protein